MYPPKLHVHPEPQHVTLFGNRALAYVMYGDELVPDQSGPKSNARVPCKERYSDRHRGTMAVVFQATPFVVICYSNPRRHMHHLTEEQPHHRGVQWPQSLAQSYLLESGRDKEVSGKLEPGLGASAGCRGCSLEIQPCFQASCWPGGQDTLAPLSRVALLLSWAVYSQTATW